jgi:hypothetical protein
MAPAAGSAGQSLTLTGTGFFSAGGHIEVTFGGTAAPTVCPTRSTCIVTVPAPGPSGGPSTGGPQTVPVVIRTDSGTSNSLAFIYS